jgi:hypothetical protein
MRETMQMTGRVTVVLTDRDGNVVYERTHGNRIVRTGRQLVAQLFGGVAVGTPPGRVTHMGVGTGATAVNDDQTDLVNPRMPRNPITSVAYGDVIDSGGGAPMKRIEATLQTVSDSSGGAPVKRIEATLQAVFDYGEANGADALREAGIFTAATGGTMYNRVVFDPVTKTSSFKLTLFWKILF